MNNGYNDPVLELLPIEPTPLELVPEPKRRCEPSFDESGASGFSLLKASANPSQQGRPGCDSFEFCP